MKLNDLDPFQKQDYDKLLQQKQAGNGQLDQGYMNLEDIQKRIFMAESELRSDPNKLKAHQLREAEKVLKEKNQELQSQLEENSLSFPEQRDRIQTKIKQYKIQVQDMEKRHREVQKILDNKEKTLRELN